MHKTLINHKMLCRSNEAAHIQMESVILEKKQWEAVMNKTNRLEF